MSSHGAAAATTGLLYQPQMIDGGDCGAISGMKIGTGNRSTWRKPAPTPICWSQIPHDQTQAQTQAAAVGSQLITAWAVLLPWQTRRAIVHYYNLSSVSSSSVIQHLICGKAQKDFSFSVVMIVHPISCRHIWYSGSCRFFKNCTSDSNLVPLASLCWVQLGGAPRSSGFWCIEGTAYFPLAPQSSPDLSSTPHHR
jgi:hypothetical protein